MESKFSKQSNITGNVGESLVAAVLSEIAFVDPIKNDIGLDYMCTLCDNIEVEFSVQVKSSEKPMYIDSKIVQSLPVKCKTIEKYWLKKHEPVFLLMVDTHWEAIYYLLINNDTYKPRDKKQKTITFNIPMQNVVTRENMHRFLKSVLKNQHHIKKQDAEKYLNEYIKKHPLLFQDSDEIEKYLEIMRSSEQSEQLETKMLLKKLYIDKKIDSVVLVSGLVSIFINCKDRIVQKHTLDALVFLRAREIMIPEIVKQIERNLLLSEYRETNYDMRHIYTSFLFNALVAFDAKKIYPYIKHFLEYNDPSLIKDVINFCGTMKIKEAHDDIVSFFKSQRLDVRESASRAISRMYNNQMRNKLKGILHKTTDYNEQHAVIYCFAQARDKKVKDEVVKYASNQDRDVRKSVAMYLGAIDSVENINLLFELALDEDKEVGSEAARSIVNDLTLSNSKKEGLALPLLKNGYESGEMLQVDTLLGIVNRCGSKKFIPIFEEMYKKEKGKRGNLEWIDCKTGHRCSLGVDLRKYAFEMLKRYDAVPGNSTKKYL